MKKQLLTIVGVAVMAAPAFASKARLQALGEDIYGSAYISDSRNIFFNVANVNNYKNFVTFEFGNTTNVSDSTANNAGTLTGPKAEGGVFVANDNLVYGVYLGDETNDSHLLRRATGINAQAAEEENNIGLFIGGEHGVKWGASLVRSQSEHDEASAATDSKEQEAMRARLGVILNSGTEVFSTINLTNKVEDGAGNEVEGKLGYRIGAVHGLNDWRLFAIWSHIEGENQQSDDVAKVQVLDLGAGRSEKMSDKATLFTKVSLNMTKTENEASTGTFSAGACSATVIAGGAAASVLACEEYSRTSIPVVFGLEYAATSWLALRGSVSQSIWAKEEDKDDKRSVSETTVVNAGASLLFGDMTIDGVIGNDSTGGTTPGANTGSGAGQLRTDSLMSRVAMTYKF